MEGEERGRVCVTGGTGYIASWLIMRLLQDGYFVHTTSRSHPGCKKDLSYLTNLLGASTRLKIFTADLDKPETFQAAINGCTGVFHLAHPMNLDGQESKETQTKKSINGTLAILQACLNSKTVKRVVYTSSAAAVLYHGKDDLEIVDEECWSDVDYIMGNFKGFGGLNNYYVSKTLTERAALEFTENNGFMDVVTVIPSVVHGPFVCPDLPFSVRLAMAMIFGDKVLYSLLLNTPLVQVDDLVSVLTFLLEHPNAKGRYICSSVEITIDKMLEFFLARYPDFQISTMEELKEIKGLKNPGLSSQKLLDIGFKFKYGLEDMYDGAIECSKQKSFL